MLHLYQDTPIGGGDALYAMADVNINNPEDGQMLVYDASTQRWRNVTQKSLNDLAEVTDLTNVIATGSTNATGATIPKGLYFYLNDELCQAKADIANGATFTLNTNYEVVTAGGLNSLNSALAEISDTEYAVTFNSSYFSSIQTKVVKIGKALHINAVLLCSTVPPADPSVIGAIVKGANLAPLSKNYAAIATAMRSTNDVYMYLKADGNLTVLSAYNFSASTWYTFDVIVDLA